MEEILEAELHETPDVMVLVRVVRVTSSCPPLLSSVVTVMSFILKILCLKLNLSENS